MKTVIDMAREAGFETASEWEKHPNGFVRVVSRFAELVTEQANARANNSWTLMCKKMVEAEREACAVVAETINDNCTGAPDGPEEIAAAIRARGNAWLEYIKKTWDAAPEEARPWVGLTDDEIKAIVGPYGDAPIKGYTRQLFDKIEAKLKEKNT